MLRRLLHFGQVLQSHALHFFHLASPDLLFGFDDAVAHRNIVGVLQDHPEIGMMGVKLRKYGQEVIRVLTGKRVHGTGSVPGGFNKPLTFDERNYLKQEVGQVIDWAKQGVEIAQKLFLAGGEEHAKFADAKSGFLSLICPDGALELYHGRATRQGCQRAHRIGSVRLPRLHQCHQGRRQELELHEIPIPDFQRPGRGLVSGWPSRSHQ